MSVEGRVAAVTGSGQGIGAGIARELATAGAKVVVNDIDEARAEKIAAEIAEKGAGAAVCAADISTAEGAQALIDTAIDTFGSIDILVNNAGTAKDGWLAKMSLEDWERVLRINLTSQFLCSRAAIPHMMEQKWGRIVDISSRAWLGGPGQANYAASKGGVVSLTRTMALELAKFGVTANAIAPALVDTPLFQGLDEDVQERLKKTVPMKRIGTPEDIANAVLFFASDASSYVTGQLLYVCGGRSLGAG